MELLIGALVLGFAYAFLSMGVFITMRIFNFPDITADGSLTFGASITAALLVAGVPPYLAVLVSMAGGFLAGSVTGTIHTKLKVNGLLAGILVMTALYSINLRTMGRSNLPLINYDTVLTPLRDIPGLSSHTTIPLAFFLVLTVVFILALSWLFRTDFGLAMRATGDNETMIAAQGVNTDRMRIVGIGISNMLIALSGSLVAQYQGFADIGMGIGVVVFGLASVIIGDTLDSLFGSSFKIWRKLAAVVIGSLIFRGVVALTLSFGLDPADLKLVTAFFVLLAIVLPQSRRFLQSRLGIHATPRP